ncbi:unnamed protein product [Hymenolepis diminuta]|uniref:UBIQUITIN_CONJUGAT_2 domain-containing protein n=1 Tax=Hymenolepis diminuta TaxID=6216 RepID=A0A0R3SCL3_HYMDI|nr:unnamed protein product [Hymenolepis diminuta]VUZ43562.1 unnamed protein product [Hymenolepis diminuta]
MMSIRTQRRTFYRDVQNLYRNIESSTNGQASIEEFDDTSIKVALRPTEGINAHAVFYMNIKAADGYPIDPPDLQFASPIFHPNIDSEGSICINMLDNWESCYGLMDAVKAIIYLIANPNYDDPNNGITEYFDPSEYEEAARRLLAGLTVDGVRYEPNVEWCKWARENGCFPTEDGEEGGKDVGEEEEGDKEASAMSGNEAKEIESIFSDELSIASPGTAPSVGNLCYSFSDDQSGASQDLYFPMDLAVELQRNRIMIQEPGSKRGTIFYFVEMLGNYNHLGELGRCYKSLFSTDVAEDCQIHPETRQTSQSCHWRPVNYYQESAIYSSESEASAVSLNYFTDFLEPTDGSLKWEFDEAPSSSMIGSETSDLVESDEDVVNDEGVESGYDEEEEESESGETPESELEPKIVSESLESGVDSYEESEENDGDSDDDFDSSTENEGEKAVEEEQTVEKLEGESRSSESDDESYDEFEEEDEDDDSSTEASCPPNSFFHSETMRQCAGCVDEMWTTGLLDNWKPTFKWLFRRTRWPVRFAPQQKEHLSMTGINIPPWRASSALMLRDICRYCANNEFVENLALLDPLTLSPLSPLLNLMQYTRTPRPQLTGILWMTPLDAISPLYRVPIPVLNNDTVYPQPMGLRVLTLGAFVTNWVSWISRMEAYSARGKSRISPNFDSSLASGMLEPMTLGCGQMPIFDLWPLWALRSILNLSLRFSQHKLPLFQTTVHFLFPFSDIDEI